MAGVAGIFLITLLAYFPALNGGVLWDDASHLTTRGLQSIRGLGEIWFKLGATQQYYPVLHTAFWLEHRLWGDATAGYHLVNVGLHATAACVFAVLLARIQNTGSTLRYPGKIEWLAAAVFALHPVCVESVAWISEQKNTLSLVFYLLSALAYLRFEREGRWASYAVALGFFVLAVLTKSVTATLPAALLLVRYWQKGNLGVRRDWLPLIPWFVIGIAAGLFTAWVERHYIGAQGTVYDLSLLQRGLLAGRIIWFYLGKLLWPANLIFIYPHWTVATTWAWGLGAIAFVAVVVGFWRMRGRSRGPLVAWLFFAGSLFPALGFVYVYPFQFSYVADHWQYLPALGVIAGMALGGKWLVETWLVAVPEAGKMVRILSSAVAALVLMGFSVLTWRQAHLYRSVETLYQETLRKNPGCWLAQNNLGLLRLDAERIPEAIDYFKAAIRTKPDCADAYNNLGNAYTRLPGHAGESVAAFEQALRYYPDMAEAHGNLGWALVNEPARFDEGIAHLRRALQLRPDFYRAHNSLGLALSRSAGTFAESVKEFEAALAFDPDYAAARINLGNTLLAAGRVADAILQFELARQITPGDPQVHYDLGLALARSGRPADAALAFEYALRLQPDNAEAHDDLGNVLSELGDREAEALAHYRRALELDPNSAKIHFNLALALRASGDGSEAVAHYQTALRLAPGRAEIWNSFGSFLFRLQRISDAAIAYREAIRLQPDVPLFHNNLGTALTEMHRFDEAMAPLRRAIALAPDYAEAHYNLGVALQSVGRNQEAAEEFKASGKPAP